MKYEVKSLHLQCKTNENTVKMPPVQAISQRILNSLLDFGKENLMHLFDENDEAAVEEARTTLLGIIDEQMLDYRPEGIITETRPKVLSCDVVRFQNKKDKWVAFVGLLDGYPYEIFTGVLDDEDGLVLPKSCVSGLIIKSVDEEGNKRYDFQFTNKRGYKTTVEGLSERFNKEYWNYAKLISGVLRYRMPIGNVVKLVGSLQLENENINTWASGVAKVLKRYANDNMVEEQNIPGDNE